MFDHTLLVFISFVASNLLMFRSCNANVFLLATAVSFRYNTRAVHVKLGVELFAATYHLDSTVVGDIFIHTGLIFYSLSKEQYNQNTAVVSRIFVNATRCK